MSLLSVGSNALNANQRALANVGRNIANVNSEGYSRNVTSMSEQGVSLSGVTVDVKRITDEFMVTQVWKDQSTLSMDETITDKLSFLDSIMGSSTNNISTRLDEFFASAHLVSDDPMLMSARQLFLSQADTVAQTFNKVDAKMQDQNSLILAELSSTTSGINEITKSIANFNTQVAYLQGMGQEAFEVLDERDRLVKELSGLVGITVVPDSKNRYNVFVGQGQPLIVGTNASTLVLQPGSEDPNRPQILLESGNGVQVDITDRINGGKVSGLIDYRDNVLAPVRNEMGRLAIVFANTMNEQQRSGQDLNGQKGVNMFNNMDSGTVIINSENNATSSSAFMSFYDVSKLTTSDYSMRVGTTDSLGNPTFEVTRQLDGKVFKSSQMTNVASLPPSNTMGLSQDNVYQVTGNSIKFSLDGFTVSMQSSTYAQGDKFLLQPTSKAAGLIKNTMKRSEQVAAASPLRTFEGLSNVGTAQISSVKINNTLDSSPIRSGSAVLPLEVRVHGPNALGEDLITLHGPSGAIASHSSIPYNTGDVVSVDGYEFTIDGSLVTGDIYHIEKNTDGTSDNKNSLLMLDLQMAKTTDGNNYQDAYGSTLAWVGVRAQESQLNYKSSTASFSTSKAALESVRGVNLDEEAALLVKFQQAYSAAAQLISAQQTIFNSLLSALR
jgi:flagellar hook-associated protein 1 FlgK